MRGLKPVKSDIKSYNFSNYTTTMCLSSIDGLLIPATDFSTVLKTFGNPRELFTVSLKDDSTTTGE